MTRSLQRTACSALLALGCVLPALAWDYIPNPEGQVLRLEAEAVPFVRADATFWGANWKWANTDLRWDKDGAAHVCRLKNDLLAFTGEIRLLSADPETLTYAISLDLSKDLANVIGGGLVCHLDLKSAVL